MDNQSDRESTLRAILNRDRNSIVRVYRKSAGLRGDPKQSANLSGEYMIQAILTAELTASTEDR